MAQVLFDAEETATLRRMYRSAARKMRPRWQRAASGRDTSKCRKSSNVKHAHPTLTIDRVRKGLLALEFSATNSHGSVRFAGAENPKNAYLDSHPNAHSRRRPRDEASAGEDPGPLAEYRSPSRM